MSASVRPGLLQRLRDRLDRADAHDLGRHAGHRVGDEAGQRPEAQLACALARDITTAAAAPSDICEALPAVTMPSAAKAGFSFASAAASVSRARALVGVERDVRLAVPGT